MLSPCEQIEFAKATIDGDTATLRRLLPREVCGQSELVLPLALAKSHLDIAELLLAHIFRPAYWQRVPGPQHLERTIHKLTETLKEHAGPPQIHPPQLSYGIASIQDHGAIAASAIRYGQTLRKPIKAQPAQIAKPL